MMIRDTWEQLDRRFPEMKIDAYVVMPNHMHGIVWLVGAPLVGAPHHRNVGATTRVAPTLGDVVGVFKSITTDLNTIAQQELKRIGQ